MQLTRSKKAVLVFDKNKVFLVVYVSLFQLSKVDISEGGDTDVAIVEIDTSTIPLDVLFHLTVQSSTIRFEGQQLVK